MKAVVFAMKKQKDHTYDDDVRSFRKEQKDKRKLRQLTRDNKRQAANDDE